MYKFKFFLGALLVMTLGTVTAQDRVVSVAELPAAIRKYVSTHFPNSKVLQAVEDKELRSRSYEVTLEGNIKLEFDRNDEIKEIDGRSKLPDSVLSEKIREYVATHYPNNTITDWEKEDVKQQVGLDNGVDLEFTLDGVFLRIDD